jgi:hypothetical protein
MKVSERTARSSTKPDASFGRANGSSSYAFGSKNPLASNP